MYIYSACDIFYICSIIMRGRPIVVVEPPGSVLSLRAPHSAPGFHHSMVV